MGTGLVPLIMFSGMLHQKKIIIISASSFFFFSNSSLLLHPQDPNWKLRLISLSQPLHPLTTFSADTCVCLAAAQSFKMSLSVKTCLILFLITASYCMASVPTPNLDLPRPFDSVLFGSCILTSKVNYIGGINLRALHKLPYLILARNFGTRTTLSSPFCRWGNRHIGRLCILHEVSQPEERQLILTKPPVSSLLLFTIIHIPSDAPGLSSCHFSYNTSQHISVGNFFQLVGTSRCKVSLSSQEEIMASSWLGSI